MFTVNYLFIKQIPKSKLYVADFYNLLNGKNTNSNFADNLRKWFTFSKKFPCKKIVPLFPLDKEDERPHTKCEKTKQAQHNTILIYTFAILALPTLNTLVTSFRSHNGTLSCNALTKKIVFHSRGVHKIHFQRVDRFFSTNLMTFCSISWFQ